MEKRNKKDIIWGKGKVYLLERLVYIYEEIKGLGFENFDCMELCCGNGIIVDALSALFPEARFEATDIKKHTEWEHLRIEPELISFQSIMKRNRNYDIVIMLDTYRNWMKYTKTRDKFDKWIAKHTKYFITSISDDNKTLLFDYKVIGRDNRNKSLVIYDTNVPVNANS